MPNEDDKVKLPSAWAQKATGPKKWTATGRGDDPSLRKTHAPTKPGIGDGKAFFFLFGFKKASKIDQDMLGQELAQIDDDIATLCDAGYTVVVDPQGTKDDFLAMLYGTGDGAAGLVPSGFYWSAHGHSDGAIECCDGATIRPADVDATKVHAGLRLAIFGACYVGNRSKTWRKALGGKPLVVGWGQPVTIGRAVDFLQRNPDTTTDLDDLLARWLLVDAALPAEPPEGELPAPATDAGRREPIADRIARIAQMLGARWHEHGNHYDVEVPLAEQRTQMCKVFAIDASEPFAEGEVLFGVESEVGEITALVEPARLLADCGRAGYGRISLVKSTTDMPTIVAQAFLPLARASDNDLAAHVYQVARKADTLEHQIFGGDAR